MTEKSTAKTVQSCPGVERFGGMVRSSKSELLKSSGAVAQLNRQRKTKTGRKKKRREEGKDGSRERRRC